MDDSGVAFGFFSGSDLTLRYGINEYIELETATGKTPMEVSGSILKLSILDLRTTLWIGLKQHDRRKITREWIGTQLQEYLKRGESLLPILQAIDEAFAASGYFQTPEEAARNSNGNPSAPLKAVPKPAEVHSGSSTHGSPSDG